MTVDAGPHGFCPCAAGRHPASDPRRPYVILLICRVDCVFPLPAGRSLADMAASIIGGGSEGHSGSALYHLASLFNHSCMPNLDVQFLENNSRWCEHHVPDSFVAAVSRSLQISVHSSTTSTLQIQHCPTLQGKHASGARH